MLPGAQPKMSKEYVPLLRKYALCISSALLTACAGLQNMSPEEWVAGRALDQAEALMDADYARALTYVTPSYREGPNAELYAARFSGSRSWDSAEVRWVKCEADENAERCDVRIWVFGSSPIAGRYQSQRSADVPTSLDSVWIKIEGNWYQYLD